MPKFRFIHSQGEKLRTQLSTIIQSLLSSTRLEGRFLIDFLAWTSFSSWHILLDSSSNSVNLGESYSSLWVSIRWSLRLHISPLTLSSHLIRTPTLSAAATFEPLKILPSLELAGQWRTRASARLQRSLSRWVPWLPPCRSTLFGYLPLLQRPRQKSPHALEARQWYRRRRDARCS